MFGLRQILLIALASLGALFTAVWGRDIARRRQANKGGPDEQPGAPSMGQTAIGFFTIWSKTRPTT